MYKSICAIKFEVQSVFNFSHLFTDHLFKTKEARERWSEMKSQVIKIIQKLVNIILYKC